MMILAVIHGVAVHLSLRGRSEKFVQLLLLHCGAKKKRHVAWWAWPQMYYLVLVNALA